MENIQTQIEKEYSKLWSNPMREVFLKDESGKVYGKWEVLVDEIWVNYPDEFEKRLRPLLNIRDGIKAT